MATRRIGLNIFLHCVFGPHRKPVEHMATMLPSEYGMAKFDGLLIALCFPGNHDKVAKKLQAHPRQKHMPKPHNRWLYVKLGMQPSSLLLKKPPPPLFPPIKSSKPIFLWRCTYCRRSFARCGRSGYGGRTTAPPSTIWISIFVIQ